MYESTGHVNLCQSPTKNPTPPPVEPGSPTQSPTTKAPSKSPTKDPTKSPVTSSPTTKPVTSSSAAPTRLLFTGDVPASVDFVASLNGLVSAEEIMEGKTNQVKIMLEEQLLVLSDIVIMEEFWNGTNSSELTEVRRKTARRERKLIVREATLATVDTVEDVGE